MIDLVRLKLSPEQTLSASSVDGRVSLLASDADGLACVVLDPLQVRQLCDAIQPLAEDVRRVLHRLAETPRSAEVDRIYAAIAAHLRSAAPVAIGGMP